MDDKKIIIDGVDVSGCEFATKAEMAWDTHCRLYDYNYCIGKNCYYKQLKRKEQECERLNNIINEATNSKLDLKSFLVGEAIQNEYEEKLKVKEQECEKLKDIANRTLDKLNKYLDKQVQLDQLKQTIEEIKELMKVEIECKTYEIENDCFNETRCKALKEHIDFTNEILKKISEVKNG